MVYYVLASFKNAVCTLFAQESPGVIGEPQCWCSLTSPAEESVP
jgi:hypothetical protein